MVKSQPYPLLNSHFRTAQSKLIILPGSPHALGGTLISLVATIKGFERCNKVDQLNVLTYTGSLMEKALVQAGFEHCLVPISATSKPQYLRRALHWVTQQPHDWPLLLENCVQRNALLPLLLYSLSLRRQRRRVYLLFRDLATSYNQLGYIARKLTFMSLGVQAICNSHFTAQQISQRYTRQVKGILYPSVDLDQFNPQTSEDSTPPPALQPIVQTEKRLMLTVSRINKPGIVNDKNLRIIPAILAALKHRGYDYYGVIVGPDKSPNQERSRVLEEIAQDLGVADRFKILPPDFKIEAYYQHADVLVTLAPREPFGRTVVEAIACGLPVIGSNTGGISEILSQIAPEWTVPPDDPVAAAKAIIHLENDPDLSEKLARGQRWVQDHCSMVNSAKTLMDIVGLTRMEDHE